MGAIRKLVAALCVALVFSVLLVVSVFASLAVLAVSLLLVAWVSFKRPRVSPREQTPNDPQIIDAEYRVIETPDKQIK